MNLASEHIAQTKYIKSSRDNIEIALDERYSKNSSVCVILVHGMGEHKGRYKDLLEKGILTQEEFDAKKNQLLGL